MYSDIAISQESYQLTDVDDRSHHYVHQPLEHNL